MVVYYRRLFVLLSVGNMYAMEHVKNLELNLLSEVQSRAQVTELATVREITNFVKQARTTAMTQRSTPRSSPANTNATMPVTPTTRTTPITQPSSWLPQEITGSPLTDQEIKEISGQCKIAPEAFATFLYTHHNVTRDPHDTAAAYVKKLLENNPDDYALLQALVIKAIDTKQVAQAQQGQKIQSKVENTATNAGTSEPLLSEGVNFIKTEIEKIEPQSQGDKAPTTEFGTLSKIFTDVLMHHAQESTAEAQRQKSDATRNFWIAVVSTGFTILQGLGWPIATTIMNVLFNHTPTVSC